MPATRSTACRAAAGTSSGKTQLTVDEARRWAETAHGLADRGDVGAIAAMATLYMGLRCSEVTQRVVRDLDDGGRRLRVTGSKTEAGVRQVQIPEALRPYFARLVEGRRPDEPLFGRYWRDWPREQVQWICAAVGVRKVSAHAMRGLHASLAVEAEQVPHAVAASLGHEDKSTTLLSYATPQAAANARQRRTLRVLRGGAG